ncbi:zona pellucida-like domain-containing protein 1 [Gadus chalcogrammus]|uniref:zona pellucida-like domain-containing protein 1 n=1 Tax=Gadus chalcogrammus TaxID=1042646 RepID=UPI0024C2C7E6|nr:zona pellucida-like domain-containing protein 1 [Gadus chalcogrammus]
MRLTLFLYQVAMLVLVNAQQDCFMHPTFREPSNADIEVSCGTQQMAMKMLLCPIYFCGYNESLMSLNGEHDKEYCKGVADWTVDPPVLRFNFSITEEEITVCSNKLTVTEEMGNGVFSDFSSLQYINISGQIKSQDPILGTVAYREEMMYMFSCRYPLQYLVSNSTDMSVAAASLSMNEESGSFSSTLRMALFSDNAYSSALRIPQGGLKLKTRIFVQVAASNLSNRFNVVLDRCYASTTFFSVDSITHDLFVGCNKDGQTIIAINGMDQNARFSFEAFRFVQQRTSATFYLHCSTRLCERSSCPALVENCSTSTAFRRRRSEGVGGGWSTRVSDAATVSSGPITTRMDTGEEDEDDEDSTQQSKKKVMLGVVIAAGILVTIFLSLVAFITCVVCNSERWFSKPVLYRLE